MIVDFPHKPRPTASGNAVQTSTATSGQRTVRFAEMSEIAVFGEAKEEELGLMWYSKAERSHFRWQLMQDAATQRRLLATISMDKLGDDDVYNMVGLEFYLSNELLMFTPARRKALVDAILGAYERHCYDLRENIEAEVSLTSRQSSEWVSSKCHQVATNYWTVLKR